MLLIRVMFTDRQFLMLRCDEYFVNATNKTYVFMKDNKVKFTAPVVNVFYTEKIGDN